MSAGTVGWTQGERKRAGVFQILYLGKKNAHQLKTELAVAPLLKNIRTSSENKLCHVKKGKRKEQGRLCWHGKAGAGGLMLLPTESHSAQQAFLFFKKRNKSTNEPTVVSSKSPLQPQMSAAAPVNVSPPMGKCSCGNPSLPTRRASDSLQIKMHKRVSLTSAQGRRGAPGAIHLPPRCCSNTGTSQRATRVKTAAPAPRGIPGEKTPSPASRQAPAPHAEPHGLKEDAAAWQELTAAAQGFCPQGIPKSSPRSFPLRFHA